MHGIYCKTDTEQAVRFDERDKREDKGGNRIRTPARGKAWKAPTDTGGQIRAHKIMKDIVSSYSVATKPASSAARAEPTGSGPSIAQRL
eukprot:1486405-Pyramimonas_sp.AAC.1